MATARITKSLDTLRSQVNKLAPKRSKISDGWLGDKKHSMRKSDHNPEPDGTVDALDITHDPANGVDIQKLCDAIIASKDRRVSYLICNGKIIAGNGGPSPWKKRKYNGANKHTKHLHVSVLDKHQDDTSPWDIAAAFGKAPKAVEKKVAAPSVLVKPLTAKEEESTIQPGEGKAKGDDNLAEKIATIDAVDLYDGNFHPEIEAVQKRLDALGYPEFGEVDGKWGTKTRAAVLAFRADNTLPLVPLIDDRLMAALMVATPRYVNPARANATVADLREKGAEEIKSADITQVAGGVAAATGVVTGTGTVLEQFEEYGGILERAAEVIAPFKDFLTNNALLLLIGVGGVVIWQAWRIKKIRVEQHQTAKNVSL